MLSLFALLLCPAFASTEEIVECNGGPQERAVGAQGDFDFYILALQHSPAACYSACANAKCTRDGPLSSHATTIHGLWPNYFASRRPNHYTFGPAFCKGTGKFGLPAALFPSDAEMQATWPSFCKPNRAFLACEYKKHGSCMKNSSEAAYFSTSLELARKFDVMAVLEKRGIVPSTTTGYSLAALQGAFTEAFGAPFYPQCNKKVGDNHITEFHIALNKDFEIMEGGKDVSIKCDTSRDLFLLPAGTPVQVSAGGGRGGGGGAAPSLPSKPAPAPPSAQVLAEEEAQLAALRESLEAQSAKVAQLRASFDSFSQEPTGLPACIARVAAACPHSQARFEGASLCKSIKAASGVVEGIAFADGSLALVDTSGGKCHFATYALGSGIKTLYELDGTLFALTTSGRVFVARVVQLEASTPSPKLWELLSGKKKPYKFAELTVLQYEAGGALFIGKQGDGPDDISAAVGKQIAKHQAALVAPREEGSDEAGEGEEL